MSINKLTKDLIELAQLHRKNELSKKQEDAVRRTITKTLIVKLYENTVSDLIESLSPVFQKQIKSIVDNLLKLEIKAFEEQAHALASLVFDPQEWFDDIVNKTLPVLALNMARAGVSQLLIFGIDVRKSAIFNQKQSGSDWVEEDARDYDELLGTFTNSTVGTEAAFIFMTELPEWMKKAIVDELAKSFAQDYWREISITTQRDAEVILKDGLLKGWSTRKMATEMSKSLGGSKYGRMRATRIARTESGGALNAVRRASIDQMIAELGPAVPIQKVWLSVLADTTRDDHANLDGVPADSDGLWNLAGNKIPHPGHFTLPPEQKINCLCTLVSELGVTDAEARVLIAEHEQRISEINEAANNV